MTDKVEAFSKTDLLYEITYNPGFVPHRAPRVNVRQVTIEGATKYFMKNHETGGLYELNDFANSLWSLIDGKHTAKEISETLKGMYKDAQPDEMKETLAYYADQGVLRAVGEPASKKRLQIVSAFQVRVNLVWESTATLRSILSPFRRLLKRWLLWPILVFSIIMGLLFAESFVSIFAHKENFEIFGSTVVGFFFYFFIVLAPIIVIHELAHGLALVHYGGSPREMGTGLYFFGPMFFIDVTDVWTISRYQRIMVFAAGPLSEFFIGSILLLAQYLWHFTAPWSHTLTMAAFYCFYGLLIDLSPLLEADGYWILSDLVKIPDLREKSFNYLKEIVRRPFRKAGSEEGESVNTKMKAIFLIYSAMAAAWGVYLVYRSFTIMTYMAQDTASSVFSIASAILLNNPVTIAAVVVSAASVLYFGMTVSGYGVLVLASLKKVFKRALRLEAIHDRDLSVYAYLPEHVPQQFFVSLSEKMAKAAKGLTHRSSCRQGGPVCVTSLRLSSAKLALVQLREHFSKLEKRFNRIYQEFLRRHRRKIFEAVGVYSSDKASLASLLSNMAKQTARMGIPEAKTIVSQIVERQAKTALYLLSSTCGSVWTVEVPPALLQEVGETLLPGLVAEDVSITDLYDETEDFKKRFIYGFDSLAKLAEENQKDLQDVLSDPGKYQVISFFEPIKNRVLFAGRTEQIENVIDSCSGLFVCQTWSGYLDHLLGEVNLSLFALSNQSLPNVESVSSMKDGELTVLENNLTVLNAHEKLLMESVKNSRQHVKLASLELERLRKRLTLTDDFKIGLLDNTLQVNAENLANMPQQLDNLNALSKKIYTPLKALEKTVRKELGKRKPQIRKRKTRSLALSPFLAALSVILVFLGLQMSDELMEALLLSGAIFLQICYWTTYYALSRSLNATDRYPSLGFRQVHFLSFALTQSLYRFISTVNVLAPVEPTSIEQSLPQTK